MYSGSMSFSRQTSAYLKSGLLMLINNWDENDKVSNCKCMAGAAGLVLPATKGNKKNN